MYIERRAYDDLPPDAVVLDEREALQHLRDIVRKWKNEREVWTFRYGSFVLGLCNALTTYSVGSYYFDRLRLPTGRIAQHFLNSGTTLVTSVLLMQAYVQPPILLQKECVTCVYSKALAINLGTFTVFGIGSSFGFGALAASSMYTYPVPGFHSWSEIKETGKLFIKLTQRIHYQLIMIAAFGTLSAYIYVHKLYNEHITLNQKLYERDEKLRAEYAKMQATRSKPDRVTQ